MDTKKRKEVLRQQLLERRRKIPNAQYLQKSAQICSTLKDLSIFKKAGVVHCYVSMNERREVNTCPLIKQMLDALKEVVVPVTQMKSGKLKHVHLNDFKDLKPNAWGVLEPAGGGDVQPDKLDLIIVPMAGGDRNKNRIGYGKGFYDRFLQQVSCPTVGLLFDGFLVEELPIEPFDVPLDVLITEEQILQ